MNIGLDLDPSTIDKFADAGSRGFSLHCANALGFLKRFAFEGSELGLLRSALPDEHAAEPVDAIYNFGNDRERDHLRLLEILTSPSLHGPAQRL